MRHRTANAGPAKTDLARHPKVDRRPAGCGNIISVVESYQRGVRLGLTQPTLGIHTDAEAFASRSRYLAMLSHYLLGFFAGLLAYHERQYACIHRESNNPCPAADTSAELNSLDVVVHCFR